MKKQFLAFALAAAGLLFGAAEQTQAEQLIALTTSNQLVTFDSETPGVTQTIAISGVSGNIIGIDRRPANGLLYAMNNTGDIYTVNTTNGMATLVATSTAAPSANAFFGFDFNPVPDRLRVVSTSEQNLRINVMDGAAITDGMFAFAGGDTNAGANPNIVGSAYTNNFAGAPNTTLYGIDSNLDILVIQNPPNNGTLNTVGSLGFDVTGIVGFDVSGQSGIAYAVLQPLTAGFSSLYRINLATGAATLVGQVGMGAGFGLSGLAAPIGTIPEPATMLLLGTGLAGMAARVRRRRQTKSLL